MFCKTKPLFFFLFFLGINTIYAQVATNDIQSLLSQKKETKLHEHKPQFIFLSKNKIIKYNPISLTFGALLYTYQSIISQQLSTSCPYEISCSNFSKQSLQQFGLIKGIALTTDRLMRCNRIAAVDLHPLSINAEGKIIDSPIQYKREK